MGRSKAIICLTILLQISCCDGLDSGRQKRIAPAKGAKSWHGHSLRYDGEVLIKLPPPEYDSSTSVEEALKNRRSLRDYSNTPLATSQLSQLLWAAYGVTRPFPEADRRLRGGLKTTPSAGALFPLEIYVIAGDVRGLPAGIYKYRPEQHQLLLVQAGDRRKELAAAANGQFWISKAPFTIVYAAVYRRTTGKYGKRGRERYVCLEAGHSAQNIYLQCESLGLGTVAVGSFSDLKVKSVLNMSREEEPLYIMPVGKKILRKETIREIGN